MPQLDPTWFASQLFWLLVSFGVLYVLLSRMLLPRVQRTMETRGQTFASHLGEAERLRVEAQSAVEVYERAMLEARTRAQGLIADSMKESGAQSALRLAELDAKLGKQLADGEARVRDAQSRAHDTIVPVATEVAEMVVVKLLSQHPDRQAVAATVERIAREK